MSRWMLAVAVAAAACTKPNPEASCAKDGKCTNPGFPLCDVTGAIGGTAGMCLPPCVPGTIGACQGSDSALVCNASANGYDTESCPFGCETAANTCATKCTANTQCTSGICKSDGDCAASGEVVHVSANGSPTSDCSESAPCTLDHALTLAPGANGQYILLAAGSYTLPATQIVSSTRFLIGAGSMTTSIANSAHGPIFTLQGLSDITFQGVSFVNATGTLPNKDDGAAIEVPNSPAATRTLHVLDCVFTNNGDGVGGGAIEGGPVIAEIRRSQVNGNFDGVTLTGDVTVDRSSFVGNLEFGLNIDGNFAITNSISARNQAGIYALNAPSGGTLAFNTIADNSSDGLVCGYSTGNPPIDAQNNIVARNQPNLNANNNCATTGSIVLPDPATLHFVHPDAAPYDYHLGAGSVAIDAAQGSNIPPFDYDGDTRPKGNAADVGADEAF